MPSAEEIRIGPFVGGLDTYSDPTAIPDDALAKVVNFELASDGSLKNRPPITSTGPKIPGSGPLYRVRVLGFFRTGPTIYMLATNSVDATYYYTGSNWVLVANRVFAAGVQFQEKFWLIAPSDPSTYQGGGGTWDPINGFVELPNTPRGAQIIAHKSRLWVAPGIRETRQNTQVYTSTFDSNGDTEWPSQLNTFSVGGGDGQPVVAIKPVNLDLVIFKTNSTYRFSYADNPGAGTVSQISDSIGLENEECLDEHEGIIYSIYQNKIYTFVNYNYMPINANVPLRFNSASSQIYNDQSLSIWADRLIVQHQDSTYVYQINRRTWGTWECNCPGLNFMGKVIPDPNGRKDQPSAYILPSLQGDEESGQMWKITDAVTAASEEMVCEIRTKNYDFQTASKFKKMFMWGVDIIGKGSDFEFIAHPIASMPTPTWEEVSAYNWDELLTWGNPLNDDIDVTDFVLVESTTQDGRKFIKLLKALRFRQIGFTIRGTTQGDISTSPLQLFSISTYVAVRQRVVKKIT